MIGPEKQLKLATTNKKIVVVTHNLQIVLLVVLHVVPEVVDPRQGSAERVSLGGNNLNLAVETVDFRARALLVRNGRLIATTHHANLVLHILEVVLTLGDELTNVTVAIVEAVLDAVGAGK